MRPHRQARTKERSVPDDERSAEKEWIGPLNLGPDGSGIDVETPQNENEDRYREGEREDGVRTEDPPTQIGLTIDIFRHRVLRGRLKV